MLHFIDAQAVLELFLAVAGHFRLFTFHENSFFGKRHIEAIAVETLAYPTVEAASIEWVASQRPEIDLIATFEIDEVEHAGAVECIENGIFIETVVEHLNFFRQFFDLMFANRNHEIGVMCGARFALQSEYN